MLPIPWAQSIVKAGVTGHSWCAVCRDGLEDVVGVVTVAKLLASRSQIHLTPPGRAASITPFIDDRIEAYAVPTVLVPKTFSGMELLEQFPAKSTRILLVVDEYGVVHGL